MTAFHVARYYELLGNPKDRLEREGPFLLDMLARAPSRSIADLACGIGVHALWFARNDAEVFAFDLSVDMVAHAQQTRPHDRVRYAVADMRDPRGGPYGLVVCLGNSLSLVDGADDLERFFVGVCRVLQPGGYVVVQTLHYEAPKMRVPRMRVERGTTSQGELVAVKRFAPAAHNTLLDIRYLSVDAYGFHEAEERHSLRHWRAEELRDAALQAGLETHSIQGGFDGRPLDAEATDIVFTAQRPTQG